MKKIIKYKVKCCPDLLSFGKSQPDQQLRIANTDNSELECSNWSFMFFHVFLPTFSNQNIPIGVLCFFHLLLHTVFTNT